MSVQIFYKKTNLHTYVKYLDSKIHTTNFLKLALFFFFNFNTGGKKS